MLPVQTTIQAIPPRNKGLEFLNVGLQAQKIYPNLEPILATPPNFIFEKQNFIRDYSLDSSFSR